MDAQIRALVDDLFERLDELDYYALLDAARDSDPESLRTAFYRRAEVLHPDRHHTLVDTDLREKVQSIYKRIAEGYRVLTNPTSRANYDEQLVLGGRRFRHDPRKGGPRVPELQIRNLRARRLYTDAQVAIRESNTQGARIALRMALHLEPDNPVLLAAIDSLDRSEGRTKPT